MLNIEIIKTALESKAVTDTIWIDDTMTLLDYLESHIIQNKEVNCKITNELWAVINKQEHLVRELNENTQKIQIKIMKFLKNNEL